MISGKRKKVVDGLGEKKLGLEAATGKKKLKNTEGRKGVRVWDM